MQLQEEKIAYEIMLAQISAGASGDVIASSIELASKFAQAIINKRKDKPVVVNKEDKTDLFLNWFNAEKTKATGKESRFKTLTDTDKRNYYKLAKSCNKRDFEIAISNLFKSNWANENNMVTPSHFLRIENFGKYLGQGVDESSNKYKQLLED